MPTCPNCGTHQDPNRLICLGWSLSCIYCWVGAPKSSWIAEDGMRIGQRWEELYGVVSSETMVHPSVYVHTMSRGGLVEDFRRSLLTAYYDAGYTQIRVTVALGHSFLDSIAHARELADYTVLLGDSVLHATQGITLLGDINEHFADTTNMLVVLVGTHPDELKENLLHDVKAVLVPDASPESVNVVFAYLTPTSS